jgi:hypothetical protein
MNGKYIFFTRIGSELCRCLLRKMRPTDKPGNHGAEDRRKSSWKAFDLDENMALDGTEEKHSSSQGGKENHQQRVNGHLGMIRCIN